MIVTLAKDAIISGPIDLRSFQPAFQITIHLDTWVELGFLSAIKRTVFCTALALKYWCTWLFFQSLLIAVYAVLWEGGVGQDPLSAVHVMDWQQGVKLMLVFRIHVVQTSAKERLQMVMYFFFFFASLLRHVCECDKKRQPPCFSLLMHLKQI